MNFKFQNIELKMDDFQDFSHPAPFSCANFSENKAMKTNPINKR